MTNSQSRSVLLLVSAFLVAIVPNICKSETIKLTVSAGKHDRENVPVKVVWPKFASFKGKRVVSLKPMDRNGKTLIGQLTQPSLLATGEKSELAELHFVLPKLSAGQTLELIASVRGEGEWAQPNFEWNDTKGKYNELSFDDRRVLRYMYEPLDESRRDETYKVYHHVYDPTGKRLVTKGPGGLYTHHRGLFFGFNRISYGDKKNADIWHCRKGESQSHEKFLSSEAGPVVGRHQIAIDWNGQDGKVFAKEQREMTVYNVSGGLLIEFASVLKSVVGKIKLDGDPQHAGFQFRASQEVPDKTSKQTYYLRPDGKDKPGSFRNWPGNKGHVNLPWNALSFVLGEQRYTCCYLDHPKNPKEARFSERDYGRFGSYFQYELTDEKPLKLNYRIWLQEGEMDVEQVTRHSNNFVSPINVTVK